MSFQKCGTISTHWPLEKLNERIRNVEPELGFELVPTPGNPGEVWYRIMVEAESRADALSANKRILKALEGIPTGTDRKTIFTPT